MILSDVREYDTSYRFTSAEDKMYHVTIYPRSPKPLREATYRFDVLPAWAQDAIRLLDTAGSGYPVVGLGTKVGEIYWVHAVDT
jgi:hypothetical protein